ncbi:MAG: Rieske 2Fe-2S domain-containing protein [Gemmatimonadaceae bacterium]|nr:Rieske 2Fe-2S domain-containing protein [Gemmatimonadaceae bacterium]
MSESTSAAACSGECSGRRAFLRDALSAAAVLAGLSAFAPFSKLSALAIGPGGALRYPIPATDGVSIDTANEVILCRFKGDMFAFALSCPHQNTALRALPGTNGFQCPRHKSRYQPDGTFINGKATRNMDRLPITKEGNEVVVDPNVAYESDTEPMKWANALVKV